jgi:hypothetical protein
MKDHVRQALKFFLKSQIFYVFHEFKAELIISRLEQDEYYSSILFFNEGNNIAFCKYTSQYQRYYFVTFCSKNVGCLWGVACHVLWSCMV